MQKCGLSDVEVPCILLVHLKNKQQTIHLEDSVCLEISVMVRRATGVIHIMLRNISTYYTRSMRMESIHNEGLHNLYLSL